MSKKEIIAVLIFILIVFAIYSDQKFEPENIEELRETANGHDEILPPKEFTTDGCSLWLNNVFDNDFTDICIKHDIKYWKGGSVEDRKIADSELRESINESVPLMGDVMYIGVRLFGHPLIPSQWGWGYGFSYPFGY
ncbi:hypothetical protein ACFL6I_10645 [candidate division KSB1 bacterium]